MDIETQINLNSFNNLQRKLAEANERIVEFESIKAGHLQVQKYQDECLLNYAKQNQILRDTLKEAKELVSDMILAVHMPAKMAGWTEISERALKLLEGETNGKKESKTDKDNKETKGLEGL
jgi:hypothetical protein